MTNERKSDAQRLGEIRERWKWLASQFTAAGLVANYAPSDVAYLLELYSTLSAQVTSLKSSVEKLKSSAGSMAILIVAYEMLVHEVVALGLPGKKISELLDVVRVENEKLFADLSPSETGEKG